MSKAIKTDGEPESTYRKTSLVIFANDVSVECNARYADCSVEKAGDVNKCPDSLLCTKRSSIFPMDLKLEIGRKDAGSSGLRETFLRRV